jgi:hypothetical protein
MGWANQGVKIVEQYCKIKTLTEAFLLPGPAVWAAPVSSTRPSKLPTLKSVSVLLFVGIWMAQYSFEPSAYSSVSRRPEKKEGRTLWDTDTLRKAKE